MSFFSTAGSFWGTNAHVAQLAIPLAWIWNTLGDIACSTYPMSTNMVFVEGLWVTFLYISHGRFHTYPVRLATSLLCSGSEDVQCIINLTIFVPTVLAAIQRFLHATGGAAPDCFIGSHCIDHITGAMLFWLRSLLLNILRNFRLFKSCRADSSGS